MAADDTPGPDRLAAEVRTWLAAHWDPDQTVREWWQALAQSGWGFPTWPREWFGRGLGAREATVVHEELQRAGALSAPHSIGQTLGEAVLLGHGTDEQRARFLPPLATGEENWCQFFSEPGAGSDLASVHTRAVLDGEEYVVDGQKVWSSGARDADRGILVARTDSDVPKHRGISFFVIDIDQPGVELRPIRQMNGESHFNETFFTEARVPADQMIGGEGHGWAVTTAALMQERVSYAAGDETGRAVPPGRRAGLLDLPVHEAMAREGGHRRGHFAFPIGSATAMVDLAREHGRDDDPLVRHRIARLHVLSEGARLMAMRAKEAAAAGRPVGPEGSLGYVAGVLIARTWRDLALEVLGPDAMLQGAGAPRGGAVQLAALSTLSHGIQGGSEQIQRNIIGERVLGLPREPQVDRDVPFRDLAVGTQRG